MHCHCDPFLNPDHQQQWVCVKNVAFIILKCCDDDGQISLPKNQRKKCWIISTSSVSLSAKLFNTFIHSIFWPNGFLIRRPTTYSHSHCPSAPLSFSVFLFSVFSLFCLFSSNLFSHCILVQRGCVICWGRSGTLQRC